MDCVMPGKKIVVIDGNSIVFRAFYAIKNPMITSRGLYTHAIFGFLNMLFKTLDDMKPDYIAIAFDTRAPTFRHLEYETYKAGRAKTPDELHAQMPYLKDILRAMNIAVVEMDGYEADDLIGTIAAHAERAGLNAIIVTGDRDELQLVSKDVSVLLTKKGVSEFELYTPESLREKYGFGPELFVDYKGLMGDSSDNIPGLPGVGEKTAAKLIIEYGSIEDIVSRVDEVEPERIRNIIKENKQTAFMSKRLATIIRNVPIDIDFEEMSLRDWNVDRLREIYTELEFRSFLKKLGAGRTAAESAPVYNPVNDPGSAPAPVSETVPGIAIEPKNIEITTIIEIAGLDEVRAALKSADECIFHTLGPVDHIYSPQINAILFYVNQKAFLIPTSGKNDLLLAVCEMTAGLEIGLIGFGLKDDIYRIRRLLALSGASGSTVWRPGARFDAAVANYLLAPGTKPTFAQLVMVYCGQTIGEKPDFDIELPLFGTEDIELYAREFCASMSQLLPLLRDKLSASGMALLFDDVEIPLIDTLAEIELNGFKYDSGIMSEIDELIVQRTKELTYSITELAGTDFNINSPKQLGEILFEKLGIPGGKKNKNGYSTSADILEKLRENYPIVEQVLEYRMLVKLKGTYIEGLPNFVAEDGKIRAHLLQTIAATGRLSCVDPNLQNIPIRKEPGRHIRKAFVPESEGYILMSADYSQIELRILAHLSEDPALIEDFRSGADIHTRTAMRVFGVDHDSDVSVMQRSGAKAVNFGIIYGMSSFGLSEELAITRKDAERYIAEYFEKHVAVKAFLDNCIEEVRAGGYSTTIMGRRRPIPEISASQYMIRNLGERLAMNSPIQGSDADIIKVAMNRVNRALKSEGMETTLILQVHDELILQVRKGEEERAAEILKREMEGAVQLKAPLEVDVKTGLNWYELK